LEWLSQNWIFLALGIGAVFMISRGARAGGGCCGGHAGHDQIEARKPDAGETNVPHRHA
jgi:hypothetical protein